MATSPSKIPRLRHPKASNPSATVKTHKHVLTNNNSNTSHINGPGTIINHNPVTNHIDVRPAAPPVPPAPLVSDVSVSETLPPKPTVFHGRDEWVDEAVRLLVANVTARLAILGPGGMGKTTVALALLHDHHIVNYYRNGRPFLSCEALIDADSIVVSLGKLLGVSATNDLVTAVIAHLNSRSRKILVLDNLETVWLRDGGPATAVDELLGRLAQISLLSLVITCRGTDLPQLVEWSNVGSTVLEPFSLEAALETFQARAGQRLVSTDMNCAKELLNAVDRMPLVVSLLGQLARRGNTVHDLLDRWNRKRTALLRTHDTSRFNNAGVSIDLSISMLCSADDTRESLQLLSVCSTLPDGLRPDVFKRLSQQFEDIECARDNLCAYSLVSLDADGALKMLSPVRHHVLERHPIHSNHHNALCLIYFEIARQLPQRMDERFTMQLHQRSTTCRLCCSP